MRIKDIPNETLPRSTDFTTVDRPEGTFKVRVGNFANTGAVRDTVDTVADLSAIPSAANGTVLWVRRKSATCPWGEPKAFIWDDTSTATPSDICVATSDPVGRWCHTPEQPVDPRVFGAEPYESDGILPWWARKPLTSPGTGDFSVWFRAKMPAADSRYGAFEIGPDPSVIGSAFTYASFSFRLTGSTMGFLFRGNTGSSAVGTLVSEGSSMDCAPSTFASLVGQEVDWVVTRAGTVGKVYANGVDVTSSFTFSNPNGWSKSLALGGLANAEIGNNSNLWFWPGLSRFVLFNSALSPSQAASPSGVSGKLVDYTAASSTEPTDCGPAINKAIDYLETRGGGDVKLSAGQWRISTSIQMKRGVSLIGSSSGPYPSTTQRAFVMGGTTLVPWFNSSADVVKINQASGADPFLTLRNLSSMGASSLVSSVYARCSVRDLNFFGCLAKNSRGVDIDRAGSIRLLNLGFYQMPGPAISAFACNALDIVGCTGSGPRGFIGYGNADFFTSGCFFDGAMGPNLYLYGNLCQVTGSVFEFALDPRSGGAPWENTCTVSGSTFTTSSTIGHRFKNGDLIRFKTTGVLPAPLVTGRDYFAIRVSDTEFRVSDYYANESTLQGAIYGNGAITLTDAGSGTHYAGLPPAVGILLRGDHNGLTNNRSQQNYEDTCRLEGSWSNSLTGNCFLTAGRGNASPSNYAALTLVGSTDNRIIGNSIDDRENNTGFSTVGVSLDATSSGNTIIGSSVNVASPYTFAANPGTNVILDQNAGVFQFNPTAGKGQLYIPRQAGFPNWDPADWDNASAVHVDSSSRRHCVALGNTSSDWHYGPLFPAAGPLYWGTSAGNGALNAINNGSGVVPISIESTYASSMLGIKVNSTTSGEGPRIGFTRNNQVNSSLYGALTAGQQLFEILGGGFFGTLSSEYATSASIEAAVASNWASGDTSSGLRFKVTPKGSSSRTPLMELQPATTPSTDDTALLLYRFDGSAWTAKRVVIGAADSGGAGFRVLRVPN
jgi:hypothetical protein